MPVREREKRNWSTALKPMQQGTAMQRSRKVGKETILILKTLDDHNGDDAADNDVEDDVQCS